MISLDFDNMTINELTVALELDEEERELLESIKNDEWVSIPNEKEEIKHLQETAKNQLARQMSFDVQLLPIIDGAFGEKDAGWCFI